MADPITTVSAATPPVPLDPGAPPAAGAPTRDALPPAPGPMVQPGAPAPAPASPVIQQQDKAHSILGRAVRSLFGTRTDYRVDDKGNTVAVPVAEKPGELFRHIVAGARHHNEVVLNYQVE